ncbi:MAG: sialidase family protein [bacterium]|nr:sialidase family protein [bacterium]
MSKEFLSKSEVKQDLQINHTEPKQIIVDNTEDIAALGYPGQRKIAEDKNGNFYVAYRKKYDGYYQIFVAKLSKAQDSEWIISGTNKPIAFIESDQRVPSIAIDSKDFLHIVWYGSDFQNESNNRQIKYSKSTDGGNTWNEWKNISPVFGYSSDDYWQEHPNIFVGDDDKLYVVWEGKDSENKNQQVKFIKSVDEGQSWGKWINIGISPNNSQSRPSILQDNKEMLHVLMYSSLGEPIQQVWRSYSNDGGNNWSVWQNVSNSSFDARHISACVDRKGVLHVVWRSKTSNSDQTQIHYSYFENGKWSKSIIVAPSNTYQFFPSIATDKNNIPYIVWMESEKKYNFSKERPEDGKIYFSYLVAEKFFKTKLVSSGDYNFYPNFSNWYKGIGNPPIIYSKGVQLLEIIFNQGITE